jgi:hypothetical protein
MNLEDINENQQD